MLLVFTDLDGTLLDSRYNWTPAVPALQHLQILGIPVVLVTSKTFSEVEVIRRAMPNDSPFIVENGGAVFAPADQLRLPSARRHAEYFVTEFGTPYLKLKRILAEAAEESGCIVCGSGRMSDAEWSRLSGLSPTQAVLAKDRHYDEPFLLIDGPLDKLQGAIEERGARLIRGGRFLHVTGMNNKETAVSFLLDVYRRRGTIETIGLGDAPNDLGFLQLMDHPILMDSPFAADLHQRIPRAHRAPAGPAGWNQVIMGFPLAVSRSSDRANPLPQQ